MTESVEVNVSSRSERLNFTAKFEGVSNYSEYMISPSIMVDEYMLWGIKYFPGENSECHLVQVRGPAEDEGYYAKVVCHVVNDADEVVYTYTSLTVVDFTETSRTERSFHRIPLPTTTETLVFNDTIVFKIELIFKRVDFSDDQEAVTTPYEVQDLPRPAKKLRTASSDLQRLLQDESTCDVSIVAADGVAVKAHKFVLAMRSDVFRAMFTGSMSESQSAEVHIQEFTSDVVKLFVRYFYTDTITDAELADHVWALHSIAHKYNFSPLEQLCENCVQKGLSASSVMGAVRMAEQLRSAEGLRREMLMYIARNRRTLVKDTTYMAQFNAYLMEKVQQGAQAQAKESGVGGDGAVSPSGGDSATVDVASAQPAEAPQGEGALTEKPMDSYLQELMAAMTGEI